MREKIGGVEERRPLHHLPVPPGCVCQDAGRSGLLVRGERGGGGGGDVVELSKSPCPILLFLTSFLVLIPPNSHLPFLISLNLFSPFA